MNLQFVTVGKGTDARNIAFRKSEGENSDQNVGLMWLGGYRSDMLGSKAQILQTWADDNGHACMRHDYSGHGESQLDGAGDFMLGNISRWLEESLAVFDKTNGPQILVGSSMGCWIALRMLQELKKKGSKNRIAGMILIAPAPDFATELTWPKMSKEQQEAVQRDGYFEEATPDPEWKLLFTKTLFDDAKNNLVLTGPIDVGCPVHILQGALDDAVPVEHALRLAELMPSDQVTMTIVKDGDHRLSRDEDLALLVRAIENMVGAVQQQSLVVRVETPALRQAQGEGFVGQG